MIRLALPSKGQLESPTLDFLAAAGLGVSRPNERQYVAGIPAIPEIMVLFQRAADICSKVDEGSVDLGITGFDTVAERGHGREAVVVMYDSLGYGACELVLAVPDTWVDVSSVEDVADLSVLFRDKGKSLRIATKYPNLTKRWLYERGIVQFSLVEAEGALEAAPSMGFADLIADITASGTTLRENRLKRVEGGTLLRSQACFVGNRRALLGNARKLQVVCKMLELIEAHLKAREFVSVTANIEGDSPDAIALSLSKEREASGMRGPTIAKVYSKNRSDGNWFMITIVVDKRVLTDVVDQLRRAGGTDIAVSRLDYLFDSKSWSYHSLVERLKRE
jgi:ATP phosphoribosyltransferase